MLTDNVPQHEKPLAVAGLTSYRYRGPYGYVMIGARDYQDALNEARRSLTEGDVTIENLQVWDGNQYVDVTGPGSGDARWSRRPVFRLGNRRNNMSTVYIAFDKATDENLRKVRDLLDHEAMYNPNWSGAEFEIVLDDYTWIESRDEYAGTALLGQINRILNGEDE